MSKSKIDWCDESLNFFTGCRNGCSFCYARKFANRLANMPGGHIYRRVKEHTGNSFEPAFHYDIYDRELEQLKNSKKPKRIFVGSMGDMCFDEKAIIFNYYMPHSPDITYFTSPHVQTWCRHFADNTSHTILLLTKRPDLIDKRILWPSNVHLGVSLTETDYKRPDRLKRYVHGSPLLWASVEPLLDPDFNPECLEGLEWVVVGALTGKKKMISDSELRESVCRIIDYCSSEGIPVFVKENIDRLFPDRTWPKQLPKETK